MPTPLSLVLLFGTYRRDRIGARVARFVARLLSERGHSVTAIDAREVNLPILDRMFKEYPAGEAPATLQGLADLYRAADAFVIVTGEYNHSVQPGLKNLLDHYLEEYFWRPSAIVSYSAGMFGGARAAVHLREIVGELGMPSISSVFPVPRAGRTLDEDGRPTEEGVDRRFSRFAAELEWYAEALKAQRAKGTPY
jgi:NAD(P)H-dependent FMN reductase